MEHRDFFTTVPTPTLFGNCDFSTRFGLVGSCFSEAMFQKFRRYGFHAWSSPFGTLYNPISVMEELRYAMDLSLEFTVHEQQGVFFVWETAHHLQANNRTRLLEELEQIRAEHHLKLKETDVLFITVGSSWAYFLKATGDLVANCHKVPSSYFDKRLLTVEAMSSTFEALMVQLQVFNPSLKIILTVSPVRHIRDGLVENSRSKARLIEWCHAMVDLIPQALYFPSYEIVMDELRDYRFFESDGIHPNEQAVTFVWERLCQSLFSLETQKVMSKIATIRKMESHRFSEHAETESFMQKMHTLKEELSSYPITW